MNGVVKGGSGVDNGQEGEQDPAVATVVVVGFAFMVKKMQSMAQVGVCDTYLETLLCSLLSCWRVCLLAWF